MKIRLSGLSFINICAATLAPVLSIAISALAIALRKKPSWIAFSFSIAIIYSYLPIMWDSINNYNHIYGQDIVDYNLYTYSIYIIKYYFGIEFISIIFMIGFIIIFILTKTIGDKLYENYGSEDAYFFIGIAALLMTLDYRSIFDLQKETFAVAIFLLGISYKDRYLKILLFLLSFLIHQATIALIVIFVIAKYIYKTPTWILLILIMIPLISAFIITPYRLSYLISAFPYFPERLSYYLSSDAERFSNPFIANSVWLMRASACLVVAGFGITQIRRTDVNTDRHIIGIMILTAIWTIAISWNEILVERYFTALVIISSYAISRVRMSFVGAASIVFILSFNIITHGTYTLYILHSDKYDIISDTDHRINRSLYGLFMPTIFLLDYSNFGYSDEVIMGHEA